MSLHEFHTTPIEKIQSIHAKHHLVITGLPQEDFEFDEVRLLTLSPPTNLYQSKVWSFLSANYYHSHFADFSIPVNHDQTVRSKFGMTAHLLESHWLGNSKIFNALDFPLPYGTDPPTSVASDLSAWSALGSIRTCMPEHPLSGMQWGLACTAGAYSSFHVDSNGLSTYMDVVNQNSSKFWIVVSPKQKQPDSSALASVEKQFSFHNDSDINPQALGDIQVEAVLLTPGTQLYVNLS